MQWPTNKLWMKTSKTHYYTYSWMEKKLYPWFVETSSISYPLTPEIIPLKFWNYGCCLLTWGPASAGIGRIGELLLLACCWWTKLNKISLLLAAACSRMLKLEEKLTTACCLLPLLPSVRSSPRTPACPQLAARARISLGFTRVAIWLMAQLRITSEGQWSLSHLLFLSF
jgi:hypothetical protein